MEHKEKFFILISMWLDWIRKRRKEIDFIYKIAVLILSIVLGIVVVNGVPDRIYGEPVTSIVYFIGTVVIINVLGVIMFALFAFPHRKLSLFQLGVEIGSEEAEKRHLENRFNFTSVILNDFTNIFRRILDQGNEVTLRSISQELSQEYVKFINYSVQEEVVHATVKDVDDLKADSEEMRLFNFIKDNPEIKVTFRNSLIKAENKLIGALSSPDESIVIVLESGEKYNFDESDARVLTNIVQDATLLYMLHLESMN